MSLLRGNDLIELPPTERQRRRGRRVMLLMAALVVFGLGDLVLTITHAFGVGMNEVNPIGAYLIHSRSVLGLTLFKLGTIGLTVGLLLKIRHRTTAEWASWALAVIMVMLTIHWQNYNADVSREIAATGYPPVSHPVKFSVAGVDTP